jgi:hypothetical protein
MKIFQTFISIHTIFKHFVIYRNRLLVFQGEFVNVPPQQTWLTWAVDLLIKKPVVWTFNKVKNSVLGTKEVAEDIPYVHIAACKVGVMPLLYILCGYRVEFELACSVQEIVFFFISSDVHHSSENIYC